MIKEPQLTYLLELFTELGDLANDFILAGGQAMQFMVEKARATKDFDFVLDVYSLKNKSEKIIEVLNRLNYKVIVEHFQFEKQIPGTKEIMRIEFLGPGKDDKTKNIRVKVQDRLHARKCDGAEIALDESFLYQLKGKLPNGAPAEVSMRVIQPNALLMLKLFAVDDRYKNIRSPGETRHDREEAVIHAGDIVVLIHYNVAKNNFLQAFWNQFSLQIDLKKRAFNVLNTYFGELRSPGVQLYAEFLRTQKPDIDRDEEQRLINQAIRKIRGLIVAK